MRIRDWVADGLLLLLLLCVWCMAYGAIEVVVNW